MRKLISVVFTVERNLHFAQQCVDHLKQNGFVDPILNVFPTAPKNSSMWKLNRSIMASHYDIVRWFAETYDTKTHDLMVCEDDCEFVEPNVATFVHRQLQILHYNYDWSVCLLGQFAYGPIFPTEHDRLSRTTCPALAHCYVMNGQKLCGHLKWIREGLWKSPFMTEGWILVSPFEKFAIFPSVATQNRPLKFLKRIPFMRNIPVIKFIRFSECVMSWMPFVILFILLVVWLWKVRR